jgi:hypothetical protein
MAAEVKKEIELEIGHVLFIDIVGYSKLLMNEQRALLDALNQIVRGTEEFRSADAGLGRKEEALREIQHAVELVCRRSPILGRLFASRVSPTYGLSALWQNGMQPVEKDSLNGADMIQYSAIVAAWVGEKDLAVEHLAQAARLPGFLSYGRLKLLPWWDPLRGDPRFAKIVSSLAPK